MTPPGRPAVDVVMVCLLSKVQESKQCFLHDIYWMISFVKSNNKWTSVERICFQIEYTVSLNFHATNTWAETKMLLVPASLYLLSDSGTEIMTPFPVPIHKRLTETRRAVMRTNENPSFPVPVEENIFK